MPIGAHTPRRFRGPAARALLAVVVSLAFSSFTGGSAVAGTVYNTDPANRLQFPEYGGMVLATADLNGDSRPDVVLYTADGVRVALSNGDSTLSGPLDSPVADNSQGAAVADFDGDGHADIALSSGGGTSGHADTVVVARGDGAGRFSDPHPLSTAAPPFGLGVADFNGDGRADIAASESDYGDSATAVFLNQGSFNFSAPVEYAPSGPQYSPGDTTAIGDLNGDGHPDLVIHGKGVLKVLLGNGDGTFADPVPYPLGANDGRVTTGDLNNDGRDDVVATSLYDNSLSYSLAAGDGSLGAAKPLALTSPTGALVADLNGDGKRDIVGSTDAFTEPALFPGNGDGTFASSQSWGGSGEALAGAGDFNSDGQPDLFAWETAGFLALNVYLNRSTPSFIVSRTGVLSPSATVGTMASGGGVSVTNRGPGFLKPSVSFAGPDASDFSIAEGDCGERPLLVGATCSVSLSFHPSTPGTKTLEYTVTPLRGSPRTGTITAAALAVASADAGGTVPVTTPRPPQKRCVVPRLVGLTLSRAKRKLTAAHCRLGRVSRRRGQRLVVIRQKLRPRSRRAAGTRVALVLGPRRR